MSSIPRLNPRIASGFEMARRADLSAHKIIMPRDENEARGVALYFGTTADAVTQKLGPLGVSVAQLKPQGE